MLYSEIRESDKIELLNKVKKENYRKYLVKMFINKVRSFISSEITFEFPVTALIGPNGSGKSSILGAAGCAYKSIKPSIFFPKCVIGDETMSGWEIEYEIIDRDERQQRIKRSSKFKRLKWVRGDVADRKVLYFGIERTVPAGEKSKFKKLKNSSYHYEGKLETIDNSTARYINHILGKPVDSFKHTIIDRTDTFFVGNNGNTNYSEFHFGAGESSIIRMVSEIENASDHSLVLIEEIENGLHPIATQRMVEYLIDVAKRKSIQSVITTHSDYALIPLPDEGIWACINGKLTQGKLNIEALRAVSGRIDKKIAIFVEDEFAKEWVACILREHLGIRFEQIEIHAVSGDGNALKTHLSHCDNPAIKSKSLCILDGDSRHEKNEKQGILKLPGQQPELEVFNFIKENINNLLAMLTVSCQRSPDKQNEVQEAIMEISCTNRDPHLIFNQIGIKIGFISEIIVRGAFLSLWMRENKQYCKNLARYIDEKLKS